jgi:hypothetical protein
MNTMVLDQTPAADVGIVSPPPRWNAAIRVAFRFWCTYFGLYVISTQMLSSLVIIPGVGVPSLENTALAKRGVTWVAHHAFHATYQFPVTSTGSGDKTFDWVLVACLLVLAAAISAIWSTLDRRRTQYAALHKWLQVFFRFALGATMIGYGMVKVFPLQMPYPSLTRLLEPFGNFSPMGALWYSVGAAPGYERFAGSMELVAGILLFVPRLSMLGAMVAFADAVQIFTLNMTYDVPVKLFSFQLILMAFYLLAPEIPRLTRVLVLNRTAEPSPLPPLFRGRRALIAATVVQLALGAYIVGMNVVQARQGWTSYGGGAPKPPLYGIWNVEKMTVDGVERSPLLTDYGRWRRLVIQSAPSVLFGRMDDTYAGFANKTDVTAKTLTLTKPQDKGWKTVFSYRQPDADHLVLDGTMDGHRIGLSTRLLDRNSFLLVNRGFHWIQEQPFNR